MHAEVLAGLENVELAACADIRPERAAGMAEAYGCRAYGSLEDLFRAERVDVLHICTPHDLHTPMALQAAERGVNVFTEKPPSISREEFARFSTAAEKVAVGVCFQNRYNKSVQSVKSLLRSGKTGRILGARAFVTWCRGEGYYRGSGWRGRLATEGGGVLINQSIHTLDLLTEFLGTPSFAEAHAANHHLKGVIEVEDTLEAYIDYSGRPAVFYATTAHCADSAVLIELCTENATIRLEGENVFCAWKDGREESIRFGRQAVLGKSCWGSGHVAIIRDFYDCLQTGRDFPVSPAKTSTTMELMFGLYASSLENKRVYFDPRGREAPPD